MSNWLIIIFIALLLLIGVVALLLLLPDTEETESSAQEAGYTSVPAQQSLPVATHPPPVAPPPVNRQPAIMLRLPPVPERKVILGPLPATPLPIEFRPPLAEGNGSKIMPRPVKVNLNVICRRTGRSMRVCSCERCGKERAQFGF
jgi:hypothetical protein